DLNDALRDPARVKDAVKQLAQHVGFTLQEQAQTASEPVQINPELEFMRPMFQAFKDEAKREAIAEMQQQIAPLQQQTNQIVGKSMAEATTATLTAFGQSHPGWEKHEGKMLEIANQIQPTGNMSDSDYLEVLYKLATHGQQSAQKTK